MRRRGITFMELVIAVALVGILAAIGATSWQQAQHRSKRAEIPGNVEGIRVAQMAYFASWDTFVEDAGWYPSKLSLDGSDRQPVAWPEVGSAGVFDTINWHPMHSVRGRYSVPVGTASELQIEAESNIDGDGVPATFFATESSSGGWDTGSANEF